MPDVSAFLPLLSLIIALMAGVGVVIAFLGNRNRGLSEVQGSTITALQAQNQAQGNQIRALEKQIDRLEGVFSTLQVTLKKRRGLLIEVNDDLITIVDQRTGAEQTVKIKIDNGKLEAIEEKKEEN
jgi:TolA-binding protein